MSPREQRAIRNQAIFRDVHLNVASLEKRIGSTAATLPLICECAQPGCAYPIEVDHATFKRVREDPLSYLVASGHEQLDVESVVERTPGHLIVEQHVS